jgi:hypothetical protein
MIDHTTPRIIEAYVGEYASGKSENAINRAISLFEQGLAVSLADLDTVEPVYTLRPIKQELSDMGIHMIAWETRETVGLGEAGNVLHPAMRWALLRPENVIMDVGYGVHGAEIFNLIEGALENPFMKIIGVINMSRPMTLTVDLVEEYVRGLGRVDALLNNTHLDDETTVEVVQTGAKKVHEAAGRLGIPMIATAATEAIATQIGPVDAVGCEVWPLKRLMPKAFW